MTAWWDVPPCDAAVMFTVDFRQRAIPNIVEALKPGAHALVLANEPLVLARAVGAFEDAGLDVRDGGVVLGEGIAFTLARKPLIGTVAQNVLRYGTGGLNIDGCRVAIARGDEPHAGHRTATFGTQNTVSGGDGSGGWEPPGTGRWPANVILDAEAGALLDQQSGEQRDGVAVRRNGAGNQFGIAALGVKKSPPDTDLGYGGGGGASRFFWNGDEHENLAYLCRLITPDGGAILDPFDSPVIRRAAESGGFSYFGITV